MEDSGQFSPSTQGNRTKVPSGLVFWDLLFLSGTLMHDSHLSLRYWFWAAYLITTGTPGISATQPQRQLGLNHYETAWFLLQRLRNGMVKENREMLSGLVEADETYIGGPAKGFKGRGVKDAPNKALIAGAVEVLSFKNSAGELEEKAGRLRLGVLSSAGEVEIKSFLNANVALSGTVKTHGWKSYSCQAMKWIYSH